MRSRFGRLSCLNELGENARYRGDLERAEQYYWQALSASESGEGGRIAIRLNLVMVLLARGRHLDTRSLLEDCRRQAAEQGRVAFLAASFVLSLPSDAVARDWVSWDEHMREGRRLLAECAFVDGDIATAAELAEELARRAGEGVRAEDAAAIAHSQRRALSESTG